MTNLYYELPWQIQLVVVWVGFSFALIFTWYLLIELFDWWARRQVKKRNEYYREVWNEHQRSNEELREEDQ